MYVLGRSLATKRTSFAARPNYYSRPRPNANERTNTSTTSTTTNSTTITAVSLDDGTNNTQGAKCKSYESIPRVGLMGTGNLLSLIRRNMRNKHIVQVDSHKKYGPMLRIKIGTSKEMVEISDPKLIEELLRKADKNPIRLNIKPWLTHRNLRGVDYGLLTLEDEAWARARSVLSKRMMRPKEILQYLNRLGGVADDMIERLIHVRDTHSEGGIVVNLDNELYKWAMESVAVVLFDTRLGCLENTIPADAQAFIDAVVSMFSSMGWLMITPMKWNRRLNTKPFRIHMESWDVIWNVAKKHIDRKCALINADKDAGKQVDSEVDLLTYLMANDTLSAGEICGNVVELFMAAIDTTSNTLLWALYKLSQNQHCQERLHKELIDVLNGESMTAENLQQLPYLKSVVKEITRLFPALTAMTRIPKTEITINGYQIPARTPISMMFYCMMRDENNFKDANAFKPERWLYENRDSAPSAFASIPFGYGPRMCIGKRMAEMELYLALSKICQTFKLEPTTDEDLVGQVRGILAPEKPIPVKFISRN